MPPRSALALLLAIAIFTRPVAAADAPSLIINGTADWTIFNTPPSTTQYKFQILTSPAGWKMSITRDNPVTSRQLGSDGLKLYEYYDATPLKDTAPPLDPKFLAAHGIDPHIKTYYNGAIIENGHFPTFSGKESQILWLAFCYPHYYATLHETNPIYLSQISYQITRHARMTIDTDSVSDLPNRLHFFSTGKYLLFDHETNLPPPLDQGYLLWDFQVLTTTNIAGQPVPLTAQYEQFYPQSRTNGVTLSHILLVNITVDNIARAQNFAPYFFQPTITNQSVILHNYAPEYPPDADPARTNAGLVSGTLHNGQWPKPAVSKKQ